MNDANVRTLTAISGILATATVIIVIPLYFVYSGPPPATNVLTRVLITLATCMFLLVFISGYSQLVRQADNRYEWLASFTYGTGLLFIAVTLVSLSLEAGVVFGSPGASIDPTTDGPLAHANILIYGSIKRLLSALYLAAAGHLAIRTRLLPGWLGWAAYAAAAFNLFFVPSLYFGTDPTQFYSAHGWGNSAFAGSLIIYWVFAASVVLLRKQQGGRTA